MAEVFGAIGTALTLVPVVFQTWKKLYQVSEAIGNEEADIRHWTTAIEHLNTILPLMCINLENRQESTRSELEKQHYEVMKAVMENLGDDLKQLNRDAEALRHRPTGLIQKFKHNAKTALRSYLRENNQLYARVERNITLLFVSHQLLLMLPLDSFRTVKEVETRITAVHRQIYQSFPEQPNEEHQITVWRESAMGITQSVFERKPLDDDIQSTIYIQPLTSPGTSPGTAPASVTVTFDDHEGLENVSSEELEIRYRAYRQFAAHSMDRNLPLFAARYQLSAIEIQNQLHQIYDTPFQLQDHLEDEKRYIAILMASSQYRSTDEDTALQRLERLSELVDSPELLSTNTKAEVWSAWRSVGAMYLDLDKFRPAKKYLRRALEGYLTREPRCADEEIQNTSRLLSKAYEATQDGVKLAALRAILLSQLGTDPTRDSAELEAVLKWCRDKKFEVTEIEGRLQFTSDYNGDGYTALHEAAMDKNITETVMSRLVFEALSDDRLSLCDLRKGCNDTAIFLAAEHGNNLAIRMLSSVAFLVNVRDSRKQTPLHRFVMFADSEQDLDGLQVLLDRIDINSKDRYGRTALHYACRRGKLQMVQKLLNNGADVNALCNYKETPLLYACFGEMEKPTLESVIKELMDRGADATCKDYTGETPRRALLNKRGYSKTKIEKMLALSPESGRRASWVSHVTNSLSPAQTFEERRNSEPIAPDVVDPRDGV